MRQVQSGGNKALSFGKSKAKLSSSAQKKVTFRDVAGAEEAKSELQEIIEFLKEPQKFQKLGGRIPKGVLLMGPPGTGKTLLARAVAGEANVPFFSISGSDFVEMFVGVGASRVRDLFEQGKKNAPCIIFIDEIDAVGRHRGAGLGGGHDEREQTLNQLLVEMDGFESNEGVILMAATNRPDVLDPALLRPGRFDRRVIVNRPDVRGREGILAVHTRKIPMADDVDIKILARGTVGFTGADLANLVNEAALNAARENKKLVAMYDFEYAKDKVMMGAERRSMIVTEDEKKVTAIHEAGHALLGILLPHADPLHKVTIVPRGMALGLTMSLPTDEKHNYSKNYLIDQIGILLGGRIAEELTTGNITTGAGNDLERATDLARRMVCEWGMSEAMGPLTFGKKEEQIFLGREIAQHTDYSEDTALKIDARGEAHRQRPVQALHGAPERAQAAADGHRRRAAGARSARRRPGPPAGLRPSARRRADAPTRPPADATPREGEGASVDRSADGADPEAAHAGVIAAPRRSFSVPLPGRAPLVLGPRTFVMGVLNVTPDSFSDGGKALDPAHALDIALAMEAAGADIIDVGAESTRPGATPVARARGARARAAGAARRMAPRVKVPISIDTYKAAVAAAALDEGASIVNDISGFEYDPEPGPARGRARRAGGADAHARPAGRHVRARRLRRRGRRGGRPTCSAAMSRAQDYGVSREPADRRSRPRLRQARAAEHGGARRASIAWLRWACRSWSVHRASRSWPRPPARCSREDRDWATAAAVTAAVLGGAHIVRVHAVDEDGPRRPGRRRPSTRSGRPVAVAARSGQVFACGRTVR